MTRAIRSSAWTLVIRDGRVIDPATGFDAIADVAIAGERIAAVGPKLAERRPEGVRTISARGAVVLPGLIDMHAHVYEHVSGDFGLNADLVGVRSGVPVLVDQGGASALTIDGFRKFIVEPARTRVVSFISTYLAGGLHGHKYVDLYGPPGIDVDAIVRAAEANRDLVKGIKAHAEPGGYSRWGIEPLRLAKLASRAIGIPVYVHLGTLWPQKDDRPVDTAAIVREVLPLLDPGDIIAHPFTRLPSGVVSPDGRVHPLILEAMARGVRVDVGRGSHINFDTARRALDQGVIPYTVGADLHGYNVRRPKGASWYRGTFAVDAHGEPDEEFSFVSPYSLHHAMSEMRALGIGLVDVFRMATSNAAAAIGMSDTLGTLAPGRPADISIVNVYTGQWRLQDSCGGSITATEMIHPKLALRAGKPMKTDSPLLPDLGQLAA